VRHNSSYLYFHVWRGGKGRGLLGLEGSEGVGGAQNPNPHGILKVIEFIIF